MQIANLGTLNGPVIAWGGALGNLAALGAFLREVTRAGVPASHVIGTGDYAGYCAQGADCVAAIRAFGSPLIAGNVERQLAAGAADCGCGFTPGALCDRLSANWWAHVNGQIAAGARDWMENLPDIAVFAHEGRRWAVIHGGVSDISRYLWPCSPEADFRREITALEAAAGPVDGVIAGHAGVAFERRIGQVTWLNAGAIGLPPHDGRRATRYARLDVDGVRILRLDYDPAPAFAAMVASGLTQGYDLALMTGVWPSEDTLPAEMRRG